MVGSRADHSAFIAHDPQSITPVPIRGRFTGQSAFICLGGPSLATADIGRLQSRGVLTIAVNNAALVIRPTVWVHNDSPGRFHERIWRDPGIMKMSPACWRTRRLFDQSPDGRFVASSLRVCDTPNTLLYRRSLTFDPATFFDDPTAQIGCHAGDPCAIGIQGVRSVMLSAIKLAYVLGSRRIVLVGCDFAMSHAKPYAFDERSTPARAIHANASYAIIARRLEALIPFARSRGLEIVNATPQSHLTVFPFVDLEAELNNATQRYSYPLVSVGMYRAKPIRQEQRP